MTYLCLAVSYKGCPIPNACTEREYQVVTNNSIRSKLFFCGNWIVAVISYLSNQPKPSFTFSTEPNTPYVNSTFYYLYAFLHFLSYFTIFMKCSEAHKSINYSFWI